MNTGYNTEVAHFKIDLYFNKKAGAVVGLLVDLV
jgi:hypothetical protein